MDIKSSKALKSSPRVLDHETSRQRAISDALFSSIGEGAIVTDSRGRVSRINDVALSILGFDANEVIGVWFPEAVIAEDDKGNIIPNLERPITEVFLNGRAVFRKLFYRRKDGSRFPVALTVSPIILDGKPVGAIELFRDITEEFELDNSKDEFISIASHQLRTPATIVKQYIGMILEGYTGRLTPAQTEMLRIAYENNEHQIDTINDLLKVAQADANKLNLVTEKTDVKKLLQEVIKEQRRKYDRKNIKLTFKHNVNPVIAMVDPLHLRMVFDNLLDNAYKYSHDGKEVTVDLSQSQSVATIKVRDQGVGIEEKDMNKLFQKFSRISNPLSFVGGTGLGLYWAQKLVVMHHGTLTASSKLNKGTVFTIKIPLRIKDI